MPRSSTPPVLNASGSAQPSSAGHGAHQLPHQRKWESLWGCLDMATGPSSRPLGSSPLPCATGQVQGRSGTPERVPRELPRPALLVPAVPSIPRVPQPFVDFSGRYCGTESVFFISEGPRGRRNYGGVRRRGGGRKIEAVCFLPRFTARSTSHDTSEALDMLSLRFICVRLLEDFPEPVAGRSRCQWQLRTQGRAAAWGQLTRFICSFFSCQVNTLSFMSTSWVGPCLEKSALHRQVGFSQGKKRQRRYRQRGHRGFCHGHCREGFPW